MGVPLTRIKNKLDRLDSVVLFGAGRDIVKPKKKGSFLRYLLDWLAYYFLRIMDSLDTEVIFNGRVVRTKRLRVRSRLERQLVAYFDRNHIRFQYEKPVVLDGITLHPDFYLSDYKIYVELWGMSGMSMRYTKIMERKKSLYKKHRLPVIDLYQRHMKDIDNKFPVLFEKLTGKRFS